MFQNQLDNRGCPPLCSTMADAELSSQLVLTASDAVYLYEPDSRGPCFVFEGELIVVNCKYPSESDCRVALLSRHTLNSFIAS